MHKWFPAQIKQKILDCTATGSSSSHAVPTRHAVSSSSVSGLFDEDPGIMSEADTSSTSGRKRRQLKAEAQKYHHPQMTGSVILLRLFLILVEILYCSKKIFGYEEY